MGELVRFRAADAGALPAGGANGEWFAQQDVATLFPCAQIDFVIAQGAEEHFHLPFLIAPGGWSTYS
jgi:5-hydroxyisourate hydrolase-like protein (transthyretin family)